MSITHNDTYFPEYETQDSGHFY